MAYLLGKAYQSVCYIASNVFELFVLNLNRASEFLSFAIILKSYKHVPQPLISIL